jgi:predicted porin
LEKDMKKIFIATLALGTISGAAQAQSSVTLYGLIDAGISYASNSATGSGATAGHSSLVKEDDGVANGNRWGLKGAEDLGGGMKAIFDLENGFTLGTGALGQGSSEFGRQAWVGLSQAGVGSVTLGRQYSFSTDFVGQYTAGSLTPAGNYAFHINDVDQLTSSRLSNSIKFTSANFSGLTFGAMYAFSNQAGDFAGSPGTGGSSRAYSAGINYANGPLGIGAAYTFIGYPGSASPASFPVALANVNLAGGTAKSLRTGGIGAKYLFGPATVFGSWTNTRVEGLTGFASTWNNFELGLKYALTPALSLAASDTYSKLSDDANGRWNQVNLSVDYALSARTDVYVLGIYQKASGSNNGVAVQAEVGSSTSYFGTSSGVGSDSQTVARVGIRHRF